MVEILVSRVHGEVDCRTACDQEQHGFALPRKFAVVQVDGDDRVGSYQLRLLPEFGEDNFAGIAEDRLRRATATAKEVSHPSEEITEYIHAEYALRCHDF